METAVSGPAPPMFLYHCKTPALLYLATKISRLPFDVSCFAGKTDDPLLQRLEAASLPNAFDKLTVSNAVVNWNLDVLVRREDWEGGAKGGWRRED